MKRIARIALVGALLIGGVVQPVWSQENVDQYVAELNSKAEDLLKKGDIQQMTILAEHAYRYALEYLGPKHPETLKAEGHMAGLYYFQGKQKEAENICKNNFYSSKNILGERHKYTLEAMATLSVLYMMNGNYKDAEPLCLNALQLRRETLGEQHPDTLESINYLAMLYQAQGRYSAAENFFKQALHLRENILGKEHQDTLTSINNLALLYSDQYRYNEAEQLLKHALEIQEKVLGKEHMDTVDSMGNLASLYQKKGNNREAEILYIEAIRRCKNVIGIKNKRILKYISNLSCLYSDQGLYRKSEESIKEAISYSEKNTGKDSQDTIKMISTYIIIMINKKPDIALNLMKELENRLMSNSFSELYDIPSEDLRISYLLSISYFQQLAFSLANQIPKEKYQQYAAEVMLRWKHLYAEETKIQHQLLYLNNRPEAMEIKTQIETTQTKIGKLLRQSNKNELINQIDLNQKNILELTKHFKGNLEVESVTLEKIKSSLPANSGLIEYRIANIIDINSINFKEIASKKDTKKDLHIIAFLITSNSNDNKEIIFRDLGSQKDIANIIKKFFQLKNKSLYFSQQLQKEQPPDAAGLRELIKELDKKADAETAEIYKKILFPFDNQIKNLKQLYIAPDTFLNLLSFASLRLPDGRFLVERQQINQLQTGRDLLADNGGVSGKGMVAVGGVDYGQADKTAAEQTLAAAKPAQRAVRELFRAGVDPLPESKREVQTIGRFFTSKTNEEAQVLLEANADEYALKHLKQPPRILHLSTHGFYLVQDEKSRIADEAPLLLSGLALAGANNGLHGKLDQHGDDGLLYSLEVLGLNLHGTELVSLSACDTGKGVLDYSEGVYGLVRAFRTAGAKNVLMTLTPVGDVSSRQFMETFYENWLSSEKNISPAEALHQTRLQFIRDKKPVQDWSPYVLVGK